MYYPWNQINRALKVRSPAQPGGRNPPGLLIRQIPDCVVPEARGRLLPKLLKPHHFLLRAKPCTSTGTLAN